MDYKGRNGKTKNDHFADLSITGQRRPCRGNRSRRRARTWLSEFGLRRVYRAVAQDGDMTHRATNDLGMAEVTRVMFAELS